VREIQLLLVSRSASAVATKPARCRATRKPLPQVPAQRRHATASERRRVAEDIDRFCAAKPSRPPGKHARTARTPRRRRTATVAELMAAVILACASSAGHWFPVEREAVTRRQRDAAGRRERADAGRTTCEIRPRPQGNRRGSKPRADPKRVKARLGDHTYSPLQEAGSKRAAPNLRGGEAPGRHTAFEGAARLGEKIAFAGPKTE